MKIQEADAKSLLLAQGLPVPPWKVARTPAEVEAAAKAYFDAGAEKVVVKAQVLVGGRGKAGGVKLAGSPAEAATSLRPMIATSTSRRAISAGSVIQGRRAKETGPT